jgi:hypothetical protein
VHRTVVVVALALVATGCGAGGAVIDPGDGGDYAVTLDPASFVAVIDNPWLPLTPGSRWVYEDRTGREVERVEVTVTTETRVILGITATVVRDTVSVDGKVVEDTLDWFAQDREGNVWYLGEDSKEIENGEVVSTAGSWEAGVNGALPGIVMPAEPRAGDAYRQEFLAGEAEDMAEVIRLDGTAEVAFGSFDDLVVTREWTPLEPDVLEEKSYARGVGMVLEVTVRGGSGRAELVEHRAGG